MRLMRRRNMSAAAPAKTFGELIDNHRPTVCGLLKEAASSLQTFTEYFDIHLTRKYDTYDGIWIESTGINKSIILAPTDSFFEKIKDIVFVKENIKKIADGTHVYEVSIPAVGYSDNVVIYDNDQEHNNFAKAYIRWIATNEVLSAFKINALDITDDYVTDLFDSQQGEKKDLRKYLAKAYNKFREVLKAYCR